MPSSDPQAKAFSLLDWYAAMGVDAAVDELPHDWLSVAPVAPGQGFVWPQRPALSKAMDHGPLPKSHPALERQPPAPILPPAASDANIAGPVARARPQTPLGGHDHETEAHRIARAATTLEALEAALHGFNGCALKATAKNLCFYRGAPQARLMIIGEAPGREEDLEGRPFVGSAGQLLDKMLAAIDLRESDVHITNVVYWRPPGNRTPTPQEALACRPFLQRQMELVQPEIVVALGGSAAKEVFGVADGIMRLRGKWRSTTISGRSVPALATLHPAYLLRAPAAKQLVWLDLLQIKARLRDQS